MTEVRDRLALSHDFSDLDTAERLAKELAPWVGVAKVGLELYSAAGPEAIARMRALDLKVFADLKLHDIPTTVGRAARAQPTEDASGAADGGRDVVQLEIGKHLRQL